MSEELFHHFRNVPKAQILIEQFKDAPFGDESKAVSFLLSLACNVRMDIITMRSVYQDILEEAKPYMDEDDFEGAVESVAHQLFEEIRTLVEDEAINREMQVVMSGFDSLLNKKDESDD